RGVVDGEAAACQSQATCSRDVDGAAPAAARRTTTSWGTKPLITSPACRSRSSISTGNTPAGPDPGIVRRIRLGSLGASGSSNGRGEEGARPTTGGAGS